MKPYIKVTVPIKFILRDHEITQQKGVLKLMRQLYRKLP